MLHHPVSAGLERVEEEAHRFAAEFLVPSDSITYEFTSPVTLDQLRALKQRWGVSIQALASRARDVGVVTERQRTVLFRQISARGWRTHEPGYIQTEKPRALRKMAELLYGPRGIDVRRLAADVSWPASLVQEVLDAHADVNEMVATVDPPQRPGSLVAFPRRT